MSTELGSGGMVNRATLDIVEQGVRRLLDHLGASTRPLATAAPGPTRYFRRQSQHDYLFAPATDLFEPYVSLGDVVSAGQPAGAVHFTDEPWREPVQVASLRPVLSSAAGSPLASNAATSSSPSARSSTRNQAAIRGSTSERRRTADKADRICASPQIRPEIRGYAMASLVTSGDPADPSVRKSSLAPRN